MNYGQFTEEQLAEASDGVAATQRMRARAIKFMKRVSDDVADPFCQPQSGAIFSFEPEGFSLIETPYGIGRGWIDVSIGELGTQAVFHVQKKVCEGPEFLEWRTVLKVRFTKNGVFYGDHPEPLDQGNYDPSSVVASAILYSVAKELP